MTRYDDASYKLLFSSPELVRDLITGFIADPWLHRLDYATLERVPCAYVSDDLRQRANDVVWRVRVDGEWVYLYVMIEFQSRIDPYMAVRVTTYVGLLYQDLIRADGVLPDRRLPPVLPIVLYNGHSRWSAVTEIAALLPAMPGNLARYQPKLEYLLIETARCAAQADPHMCNLVGAMALLEHSVCRATVVEVVRQLEVWLDGKDELKQTFVGWLTALVSRQTNGAVTFADVCDLKEIAMEVESRWDMWRRLDREAAWREARQAVLQEVRQEVRQEVWEEALHEGEARLLDRMLSKRFGPLPATISARLAAADIACIERWGERLLSADRLDDVFGD